VILDVQTVSNCL